MARIMGQAVAGAVAGAVATVVMDAVTARIQAKQGAADEAREQAARPNGKDPASNLADHAIAMTGRRLAPPQRRALATVTHYALGALPGVGYALLRRPLPVPAVARGALYGAVLWAINDELLNTLSGAAGPPSSYPASSHLRGLAGHVALGVSTDLALTALMVIS